MLETRPSGVQVQLMTGIVLTVLRGSGNDPIFIGGAAHWLGQNLPDSYSDMARQGTVGICRLGPDEWLAIGDMPLTELPPAPVVTVDVSAARSTIRLSGALVFDLLAKGCALDLDGGALAPGRFAQTRLGPFAVLMLASPDSRDVDIQVGRSYTRSLMAWLADAGAEYA